MLVKERAFVIPINDKNSQYNSNMKKFTGTFNEAEIENFFGLVMFGVFILLALTMLSQSCITFDDSKFGVKLDFPSLGWYISYTSAYMRSFKGSSLNCHKVPGPCHFYMTLGYDASREGSF